MELNEPPLWENLLLENPWPLALTLVVVAMGLLWHGITRDDKRARRLSPVAAVAAVAIWTTATFTTTTREILIDRTEQLVRATQPPRDVATLTALFDPQARVLGARGDLWMRSGDKVARELARSCDLFDVRGHWLRMRGAEVTGPDRGRTRFVVNTSLGGAFAGRPVRTQWLLTWKQASDGQWYISTVQWLDLQGGDPPQGIVW
jgi:hypothetical protein